MRVTGGWNTLFSGPAAGDGSSRVKALVCWVWLVSGGELATMGIQQLVKLRLEVW